MLYTEEQVKRIIGTARHSGAVGSDPLTYRVFRTVASVGGLETFSAAGAKYLDFGCGPAQQHTLRLKREGYPISGWDLIMAQTHTGPRPKVGAFDVIIASNVLNVQPSLLHVSALFTEWRKLLKHGGFVIANLPKSPIHCLAIQDQTVGQEAGLKGFNMEGTQFPTVKIYRRLSIEQALSSPSNLTP